jgi:hypothetical protein
VGTLCSAGGIGVGLKILARARRAAVAVVVALAKGWRASMGMWTVVESDCRVSFKSLICASKISATLDPGMR